MFAFELKVAFLNSDLSRYGITVVEYTFRDVYKSELQNVLFSWLSTAVDVGL